MKNMRKLGQEKVRVIDVRKINHLILGYNCRATWDEHESTKSQEVQEDDIQQNITEVSVKGDLSPKHTKEMRIGRKVNNMGKIRNTRSSSAKPIPK
ncbi:hypothetical protein KY289_001360 [Solanum tuberosum]|nr:hypothetical protein KY289_001360 [Solanum tuberosum]